MPGKLLSSTNPVPKKDLIINLEKELQKKKIDKQVLLCFSGDPYCQKEMELGVTRQVLELFVKYDVPTAILTKGGHRCLRDYDLLIRLKRFKIGATLTYATYQESKENEFGASEPFDRLRTLRTFREKGVTTFISLEPVISIRNVEEIINQTGNFVDYYKIGKMNHQKAPDIDWVKLIEKVVDLIPNRVYFKKCLQQYIPSDLKEYTIQDADSMAV